MFGEPEEQELEAEERARNATFATNLLEVNVEFPLKPGAATKKKLPPSLTVHKLRAVLGRMARPEARPHQLFISYVSSEAGGREAEVPMDNDMRDLSFYGLASGNKIVVKW